LKPDSRESVTTLTQRTKHSNHVVGLDDDRLTVLAIAAVAGQNQAVSTARKDVVRRVTRPIVPVHAHEIEDPSVERERLLHVAAAYGRNDRHHNLP
jgi:hypothetical protein